MNKTKKLERLLEKYKKANNKRLNAYNRRGRLISGVWDKEQQKQVWKVELTPEVLAGLDADIEAARVAKLAASAELRAYCKKKRYHIRWGDSNQILRVLSHTEWLLRKRYSVEANNFLKTLCWLDLTRSQHFFF